MGATREMLSEILELCACVDQCDVSNLACMESVSRNIQYVHRVRCQDEGRGEASVQLQRVLPRQEQEDGRLAPVANAGALGGGASVARQCDHEGAAQGSRGAVALAQHEVSRAGSPARPPSRSFRDGDIFLPWWVPFLRCEQSRETCSLRRSLLSRSPWRGALEVGYLSSASRVSLRSELGSMRWCGV